MHLLAGCLVAATLASVQEPGAAPPRPPNVVLILADDVGFGDLSLHGSEICATPGIDSIARDGVRFTQAYACSSICGPSRAGLLTGRYQQRYGFEYNVPNTANLGVGLAETEITLADRFGELGYHTACIGKWHLGQGPRFHPLSRGFDHFYGFLGGARRYVPHADGDVDQRLQLGREDAPEDFEYLTDELGAAAARYVEEHREEPFFLFVSFSAVHVPLQAPDELLAELESIEDPRLRKLAAMTIALDRAVGAVLAAVDRHGLRDDTLVVFASDNGGSEKAAACNGPLRGFKGSPYEGGVRVPLLVRWPGKVPAGAAFDEPVSLLDVAPTLVAAAGGGAPEGLDGVDLLPFASGGRSGAPHAEGLFWRRGGDWAVRHGRWKLVADAEGEPELYDLSGDAGETTDVAAAHPDVVADLRRRFEEWAAPMARPRWRKFLHDDE